MLFLLVIQDSLQKDLVLSKSNIEVPFLSLKLLDPLFQAFLFKTEMSIVVT